VILLQQNRDAAYRITSNLLNNERGMTLLEVLVALLIFSLVLVTMLGSFAQAGRQNSDAYRYNEALSLAQSKIEEIKKMDFNSVASQASTSFSSDSDYNQFQNLTYKIDVVNSGLNTKTVTVTIYDSVDGTEKQLLELTAEVSKR
jgi:prepilin-type N-terminal cleavage/methylation domain-containing protein